MVLLNREWFRDARSHTEGQLSTDHVQTRHPRQQQRSIDPESLAKANNTTPALAVLTARYKVTIRAKMKKTSVQGYLIGIATYAVIFNYVSVRFFDA